MRLNRTTLVSAAGIGVVIAFVAIFVHVFRLSHESGTTYKPYSTFRSDPLGMMAMYNAVASLENTEAERYIQQFDEMPEGKGTTLVIAGAGLSADPVQVLDVVESFVATGGRLVIAFFPLHEEGPLENLRDFLEEDEEKEAPHPQDEATDEEANAEVTSPEAVPIPTGEPGTDAPPVPEEGDGEEAEEGTPDFGPATQDISERWGFDYVFEKPGAKTTLERLDHSLAVQPTFEGRSGLYLIPTDPSWRVVYGKAGISGQAGWTGIMERKIGEGTLVICSDAFFLSNEALQNHRDTELLAWLIDGRQKVLFSEAHLGTQQQDRIMTLIRRYRLHGVLFGFILMGLLFVWHHGATLLPRQDLAARPAPTSQTERSHQDGLDNLLSRFIPREQLLDTCLREWSQHLHNTPIDPIIKQFMAQSDASTSPAGKKNTDPVAAYNDIVRKIHPK